MAKLTVLDRKGNKVGTYNVEAADFATTINKQLLHDAVVMYEANSRQGSHKTKTRAEVAATGKKLYRQKGTGNSRAGSRVSGIRRGGGHIHAKSPRDYSYGMPRKSLQLATRMAIASKIEDEEVVVIDEFAFDAPKTKDMAVILNHLGVGESTVLITTENYDANVYKSARNLAGVVVSAAADLNAGSVLRSRLLVVTKSALDQMKEAAASKVKSAVAG